MALIAFAGVSSAALAQQVTCPSYPSQAAAQAAYRANPQGLRNLDADRDGIACENNPAPFDRTRVPVTAPSTPQPPTPTTAPTTRPATTPTTTQRPTTMPRTGGVPVESLALLGTAILGAGIGLRRFRR